MRVVRANLPFMSCLVNLMRPRVHVELGTHHGASFLAYCQAAKRCALATTAVAVDCREGDEHAGHYDETVFNQFTSRIKKYSGFAGYIRSNFDDAAHRFEPKSIDLLHIDGLHAYEAVKHDYETWIDKMSDRGVILFHDINVHEYAEVQCFCLENYPVHRRKLNG